MTNAQRVIDSFKQGKPINAPRMSGKEFKQFLSELKRLRLEN